MNRTYSIMMLFLVASCQDIPFENACSTSGNEEITFLERKVDIPLSSNQSYTWSHINHLSADGKDYLYGLDEFRGEINIVDLEKQTFIKTIELADEGPNEVVDPYALLVASPDSIYLMSVESFSTLYLIDSSGNKLQSWRMNYDLPNDPIYNPVVTTVLWGAGRGDIPFFVNGERLTAICDFSSNEEDNYAANYERPILATVDLNQRQYASFDFYRPETYRTATQIPHDDIANLTQKGSDFIISFVTHPQILDTKSNQYFCMSSMYDEGILTKFEKGAAHDEGEIVTAFAMDDLYGGIHYDHKLEIGYRIFKKGYGPDNPRQREGCEWSIIVFDKDLKKIGETELFPGGKYNFSLVSVVEGQGLLISRENFLDEENEEELLSLSLFTPSNDMLELRP